jgi:hypothetical protein
VTNFKSTTLGVNRPRELAKYDRQITVLRRDKALILPKNVLYNKKTPEYRVMMPSPKQLPVPGALFFATLVPSVSDERA